MPSGQPAHTVAPVIETPRLRLRAHSVEDFDSYCQLWSDPAVTHFVLPRPSTCEEVWSRLLRYAGHWALLGFGYWAVEERSTGAFVGDVGFAEYHREFDSPFAALPDLGWVLSPAMHGKGYATEAAIAALTWASANIHAFDDVSCILHPDNTASRRVAEKVGFLYREATIYRDQPTLVFTRPLRR
jgi:RimJ/RimL family protein N-acetyltransferase